MQLAIIAGVCVFAIGFILFVVCRPDRSVGLVVRASSPEAAIEASGFKLDDLGPGATIWAIEISRGFWRVGVDYEIDLPQ